MQYFYKSRGYFNYEEFYDYFIEKEKLPHEISDIAKPYLSNHKSVDIILNSLKGIYSNIVEYYLKDKDGKNNYNGAGHIGRGYFEGYTGILNFFESISKEYIVHVHTLNHDLLFERFNYSDWIQGKLDDGFEELGSPYYGELPYLGERYKIRLERYTGNYQTNFRFYKLHGSLNYVPYYTEKESYLIPDNYVKVKYGTDYRCLYKEKSNNSGELYYENCTSNYHADFLTGTTSKILRYNEPLLYKRLFENFKENLKDSEILLVVGYGGGDPEINRIIYDNFQFRTKKSFIIDPYAGQNVKDLAAKLGSKLFDKHINMDNIRKEDFYE